MAAAPSAWTPRTRHAGQRRPEPRADPVDQRAVADRDRHDGRRRQVAGGDGVGELEGEAWRRRPRSAGRRRRRADARGVLAAYASDASRAASKSSPASMTSRPGPHPRDLAAVGRATRTRSPGCRAPGPHRRRPARSCRPSQTIGRSGPILPSPASARTAIHVPRPLNERIGLTVSTLTMTGTPEPRRQALVDVLGESRKTGGSSRGRRGSRRGRARGWCACRDGTEWPAPQVIVPAGQPPYRC